MPIDAPTTRPAMPALRRAPTMRLSDALHLVASRDGDEPAVDQAFRVVARALDAAAGKLACGAYATVPADVLDDAAQAVAEQLVARECAPYRGASEGEARAWLARVLASRVVDRLKPGRLVTVAYDARVHGEPVAPRSTWPDHDPEDDPDQGAGRLQDRRRALAHLDVVRAEVARAHPGGAAGAVRGLDLWLEARGARSLEEQLVALFGDEARRATGAIRTRLVNVVYKQRSRGRAEAIAAVVRLARARRVDDLVAGAWFRLLEATGRERGCDAA